MKKDQVAKNSVMPLFFIRPERRSEELKLEDRKKETPIDFFIVAAE